MAEGQVLVFDGWGHLLAYLAAILAKKVLLGQKVVFLHCWGINISWQFLQKQVEVPGLPPQADKHQPFPNTNPQLHLWLTVWDMVPPRPGKARPLWTASRSLMGSDQPMTRKSGQWSLPSSRWHLDIYVHLTPMCKFSCLGHLAHEAD